MWYGIPNTPGKGESVHKHSRAEPKYPRPSAVSCPASCDVQLQEYALELVRPRGTTPIHLSETLVTSDGEYDDEGKNGDAPPGQTRPRTQPQRQLPRGEFSLMEDSAEDPTLTAATSGVSSAADSEADEEDDDDGSLVHFLVQDAASLSDASEWTGEESGSAGADGDDANEDEDAEKGELSCKEDDVTWTSRPSMTPPAEDVVLGNPGAQA